MPGELATAILRFGQETTNNSARDRKKKGSQGHLGLEKNRGSEWEKHWITSQKTSSPGCGSCWLHESEINKK